MHGCSWPGCAEKSNQPFTERWCAYGGDQDDYEDLVPGLPNEGCP